MNRKYSLDLPIWAWVIVAVGVTIVSTSAYFPNDKKPKAGQGIAFQNVGADSVQISFTGRLSYYAASGSIALGDTTVYTANGTTATWTLPAVAGYEGKFYVLVNKGSGNLTINSNAGGNDIYDNGAVTNSMVMLPGEAATIANDGLNWVTKP